MTNKIPRERLFVSSRFFTGFLSSRLLLGLLSGEFIQAFDCLQEKRQAVSAEIQTKLDMFWEAI